MRPMQAHASPCKPMQAHASPCKPMQAHASPCKPMQAHASPCKPMQAHASPCKPMQAHASPCKPMQAHASPCKPMQAHAVCGRLRPPTNSYCTYCSLTYLHSNNITVDFNSLFTEMFQTSEVRCEVQKFIMKFTNQFVKLAFDWLLYNV